VSNFVPLMYADRMSSEIVLTVMSKDRPGLVSGLADLVSENGGNWVESRMARLAGAFAGILRVEVDSTKREALISALQQLDGVSVQIADTAGQDAGDNDTSSRCCSLEVVGQDRPGIVREISLALGERGVNVEELHTDVSSAPMSGEPLFTARAQVQLPSNLSEDELLEALEAIASDLMVEVRLAGC